MKTTRTVNILAVALVSLTSASFATAQGTISFNPDWINNGIEYIGFYSDSGMFFHVRDPSQHGASLARIGVGLAGHPGNGTPHLEPSSTLAPSYVIFNRVNTHTFGLLSVDLADPVAPSPEPVSITFNGFKTDGAAVSQTFTVGGGGSTTFHTFLFNADFALGLTRVEIPSAAWAMDNPVWIPEPSTAALFFAGLLTLAYRRRNARRQTSS
jgi:hypothetical protein